MDIDKQHLEGEGEVIIFIQVSNDEISQYSFHLSEIHKNKSTGSKTK